VLVWQRAMAARCSARAGPRAADASRSADRHCNVRFPRAHRLTRRTEFERVLRQRGVRIVSGAFVALALPNAMTGARLGMIIGKRHLPRAVDRNRIKRAIRESFRRHWVDLPKIDVVIQLAGKAQREDARAALADIWPRLARTSA